MEKIKKHKKLTAVLAVIAAIITALAMMLPSYATSGTELIKAATEAGSAGNNSPSYVGKNSNLNFYSSWGLPDNKAYEVSKEYASRLTSIYHPKADYPATEVEASGNVKSKVKMVWYAESKTENPEDAGKTYSLDPDDGPIFKLSDSKPGKGVSLTYRNLYVYDPDDAGSLKKEKYGYVPVDLTVTVTGYSEKVYDAGKNPAKAKSYTDDPLIQFSNKVRGLPSIELYNVGAANVKYTYTYGADSSKAGQSYTIKTNMTYSDIDAGQVIALHNNKASYYVASNTGLNYVETNDTGGKYSAFYGNTGRNISDSNYDEEEKYSFGQSYETDVQRIKYVATSARNNQLTGTPTGAHTHFAASSYNMYKVVAPDPSKFVNDSDDTTATWDGSKVTWGSGEDVNTNVNGIGSPKTSWVYSVEQNMPAGVPKQWRYKSIQFDDQVSRLLKIKDVKVMCDNTNATGWFDISVSDDNHVTAKLKDTADEAQLSKIYRTDQEASLSLKITVALDRSLTMQDFRGANALVADERGEEGAIHIENKASTTIDKRSKDGTSPNTVETKKTDTYIKVPSIEDPTKKVSDSDEKKTDHNVIRFFDDEPFEYDVYQKVKSDQIHFDHFYIKDIMDPCIHEESSQGQIRVYDENENDVTDKFNVTVDEDTVGENRGLKYYTVKATAKDDVLKDEGFYGHTYDVRWKNDLKSETKYKDQGISKDWWSKCKVSFNDQTGHYNDAKDALTVPNQAFRMIDEGQHTYPSYIQDGSTVDIEKQYKKDTNKVDTTIHLPHNSIDKSSDRYEYQVYNKKDNTSGDDIIHYTIKIKNTNPDPDNKNAANYVVVRDDDFPDGLTIDPDSYKVTGFKEENQLPENDPDYGSLKHTEDEFGYYKDFTEGVNLTKNPDAKTSTARYTIKTIKNKTGGGEGFLFKTRYMQYGEEITIKFDAMADKTLNGKHVKNTAVLSSDGVPDKSDDEIVYINSPKMDVKKTVSEDVVDENGNVVSQKEGSQKSYHTGDTINYKVVVKNINPGTFARNMVFTDTLKTNNGKTPGVTIDSNSITVRDLNGNLYTRGSNAEGTTNDKKDYLVEELKDTSGRKTTGFKITFTKPNMGYYKDTSIPPVTWSNTADWQNKQTTESENKDATINAHYNYAKDYQGLQLMKGYVVTYSATVTDADLAGKTVDNFAVSQPGKNTNGKDVKNDPEIPSGKGEDEKIVPLDGHEPKLKITKTSDKHEYKLGETGHYTLKVTNPEEKSTATHCIIKDQFDITGMQIDKNSIVVKKNGEDITDKVGIDMVQTGFTKDNSSNGKVYNGFFISIPDSKGTTSENASEPLSSLTNGDSYTVTYDVKFNKDTLVDKNLRNVARASSDNCTEKNFKEPEPVKVGNTGLTAVKSSDPLPGVIVQKGKIITYTITVNNPTKEEITNVMVRDEIPDHATYYSSNDKDIAQIEPSNINDPTAIHNAGDNNSGITTQTGGKTSDYKDAETKNSLINPMDIDGHKYYVGVIKSIPAGGSATVSFKVRVNDDAKAEDIIHNVAEIHRATSDEVNGSDNYTPHRVPQELFGTATFDYTNATDHPLRYWVTADNTVTITTDGKNNPPKDNTTTNKTIDKKVEETTYQKGGDLHYTVNVKAADNDLLNPQIKDEIKGSKAAIDQNTFKVNLVSDGNSKDITKDVKTEYTKDSNGNITGYLVKTQQDSSSNSFTLKKGESIQITYTAKALVDNDGSIENTASTKADNSPDWISDTATVNPKTPENPDKTITKTVKESKYQEGDELNYTVDVKSDSADLINPQVQDEIKDGKADIIPTSIVVNLISKNNPSDITKACDVQVASDNHSYTVKTQKDGTSKSFTLKKGETLRIIYKAKAGKVNENIENVAQTKADNSPSWISAKTSVPPTDGPSKTIKKSVKEEQYSEGTLLHYTVDLSSATADLTNPQIKDEIKDGKADIDSSTLKVALISGSQSTDITKDVEAIVASDNHSYTVKTQKSGSSNDYTLKKGDTLEVTYTAKAGKVNGNIENTASGKADNSPEWISDTKTVPPSNDSSKKIEKTVTEKSYSKGDTLHYKVSFGDDAADLINPVIKDEIKDGKAVINSDSLKVELVHDNVATDVTKNIGIALNDSKTGYTVTMKQDGSTANYILAKGDRIQITYTAEAKVSNNGNIENTAAGKADNSPEWVSDTATVTPNPKNPSLTIKKEVKENTFKKGDLLHYTVTLTAKDGTVKNVVLEDKFGQNGMQYDTSSVKVLLDGKDITKDCQISTSGNGMTIKTNHDLEDGKQIVVTYAAKVTGNLSKVTNTATGKGDNVTPVTDKASVTPQKTSKTPSKDTNGGNGGNGGQSSVSSDHPVGTSTSSTPSGSTGGSSAGVAKTGDNANYMFIVIAIAAAAALVTLFVIRRRMAKKH